MKSTTILPLISCLAIFCLSASSGHAAVDMFLVFDGEKVKGETQDGDYKGGIDVLAWSWGASQSGTTHLGGGRGAGKASVQDLFITKYVDSSSADLLEAVFKGNHFNKATLIVRKPGDPSIEYIKIELEDIIVTSVSTGGSGGEDRLTENISLNFSKFKFSYVQRSGDTPKDFRWDISKNVEG